MRSKYYVAVVDHGRLTYVTEVDPTTHEAKLEDGKKAVPLSRIVAEDVARIIGHNWSYDTVVLKLSGYAKPCNDEKEDWFGVVRWCEDDIRAKITDMGFQPDADTVARVRTRLENGGFTGHQIEAGWDFIESVIWDEL